MPATSPCTPCCTTPQVVNVPGLEGPPGTGETGPAGATGATGPAGPAGSNTNARLSAYASGTAYQMTATPARLSLGTTVPSLTINAAGTWLILSRVRYDYTGATFSASRTVTTNLRRINNTGSVAPMEVTSSWKTDIITNLTYTAVIQEMPPLLYTTTNTTDTLELWGSVSIVPSAGSLDAVEAEIVCIKIA